MSITSSTSTTTRQRRSGNPARRAGAAPTRADTPPREEVAPEERQPRFTIRFVLGLLAILAFTTAYTYGVMFVPWSVDSVVLVTLLAVPAAITMAFVPEARTTGLYRWPVAWALGFTSTLPILVLVLAQTWVLSRFWLVEYTPRSPFRRRR